MLPATAPQLSSVAQRALEAAPADLHVRTAMASPFSLSSAVSGSLLGSLLETIVLACIELIALALVLGLLHAVTSRVLRRLEAIRAGSLADSSRMLRGRVRNLSLVAFVLLALGIVGYNVWLLAYGVDVPGHTTGLARSMTVETWRTLGVALGELGLAILGLLVAMGVVRFALRGVRASIDRRARHGDTDYSIERLFTSVDRAIFTTGWLLLTVLACWLLALPQGVSSSVWLILRLYLVLAVGTVLVRAAPVIIDVVDGWLHRAARTRGYLRHYDHLRRLRPTFRASVEYALWIGAAALVIVQVSPIQSLAVWGPRLVQAIGIFFLARVVVEIGDLEIGHRLLPDEGLDDMERRRRATMVPLVRSVFTYAMYFAAGVLVLASLGFNPMPFLAGAGILGLVVGFGAQSLINDVVSGFFILFENVYLVGDVIEAAGAKGVVEAIEFRVTKVRDADGRLHIVRNGDMKPVINYSKDYALAVVPVEVGYDADMRAVFATLCEAGERVRAADPAVLAETRVDGIVAFGNSTMTVRTSTLVSPGRHETVAAALRLAIKEAFDRQTASGVPRKNLIPEAARART